MSEASSNLVARCMGGDERAWAEMVRRYSGLVYAIARKHRLHDAACDDVAQTVFGTLLRRLGSINDEAALAGWLATTTRRECWRIARRERQHASGTRPAEPVYLADDALASVERIHRLRAALDRLEGRCRELLEALYGRPQPQSYEDLSKSLGIAQGSIGPTRQRCLAKLADLIMQQ